jgi:hypothetical protein
MYIKKLDRLKIFFDQKLFLFHAENETLSANSSSQSVSSSSMHGLRVANQDCYKSLVDLIQSTKNEHKVLTIENKRVIFVPVFGEIRVMNDQNEARRTKRDLDNIDNDIDQIKENAVGLFKSLGSWFSKKFDQIKARIRKEFE